VQRYQVNGNLFERWAAKFLIGFFYVIGKDQQWHDSGTGPLAPPPNVVQAVFGEVPFKHPMGLYSAFDVGDQHYFDNGVSVEPLFHPNDKGLVGANLDFKGFRFVIWLSTADIKSFDIPGSEGRIFGPNGSELMYRVKTDRFTIGKVLSQVLTFHWDN
jgi:hypothetical protein